MAGEEATPEQDGLDTPLRALARALHRCPDAVFVDLEGDLLTFRDLNRRSDALARGLQDRGVKKGDVVVSLLDTSHDVFTIWFALAKLGAIWAPINLAYRHEFLRRQMEDTGTRLAICDVAHLDKIAEIADELPGLRRVICRGGGGAEQCGAIPVEPLEALHEATGDYARHEPQPGEVALIIYTSGTTGPSKGCMLSHNYLCHIGRQQITAIPHGEGDRAWTCLPLFHLAAMVVTMAGLLSMNGVAFARRFSVSSFWSEIERSGATSASLMANIFPLLAHAPDSDAARRCFGQIKMTTGIPVAPDIRRIWQDRFGVGLINCYSYGQTEGNRLSILPMGEPLPPEGSCGRIADEFEVRIVDEMDRPLPDGELGEIVFRPRKPHVMFEGYWNQPAATLAAMRNMWMHTGDIGRMDGQYLFFCDRKKDYLRNKGENISSFEVESVYERHPDTTEVAIHSVLSASGEQELKISAVLRSGASLSEEDLYAWSLNNLPHFAVARYFEFLDELPRNPSGKVLKFALRDAGVTERTWDAHTSSLPRPSGNRKRN